MPAIRSSHVPRLSEHPVGAREWCSSITVRLDAGDPGSSGLEEFRGGSAFSWLGRVGDGGLSSSITRVNSGRRIRSLAEKAAQPAGLAKPAAIPAQPVAGWAT